MKTILMKEIAFMNTLHEEWKIWSFDLLAVNHYVMYVYLRYFIHIDLLSPKIYLI